MTPQDSALRWEKRRQRDGEPRRRSFGTRGGYGNAHPFGEDYWALPQELRSKRRIEVTQRQLKYDRHNLFLKKRLRRMQRTHAMRTLLGWHWLEQHPEHELSPGHGDYLRNVPASW